MMAGRMLCFGVFLAVASAAHAQNTDPLNNRVRLAVTASQLGPVGYRDPIGVISPDGQWIAYTSGGTINVIRTAGGPVNTLARHTRVFALTWLPDSRRIAMRGFDGSGNYGWWTFDLQSGEQRALWTGAFSSRDPLPVDPRRFLEIAFSPDGARLAGIMPTQAGSILWVGNADGSSGSSQPSSAAISNPAWTPDGKSVACQIAARGARYFSKPCGNSSVDSATQAYGPIAFSPDGARLYFASPNSKGMLDLWVRPSAGGVPTRLTSYARDTYAPSVARDGRVLFGLQDYRTFIAVIPSNGGLLKRVTTFQSEIPIWSRDNRSIAFTFGSWRRFVDDQHYPDIAQDLGLVRVDLQTPATAPLAVIRATASEDQGMDWSPNGRWIVLHSHLDKSDDIWIQPADGSTPARRISSGGIETGWPRWSPNGGWIAFTTEVREASGLRGALFAIEVDSARGTVSGEPRRVPLENVGGDVEAVEWLARSDSVALLVKEGSDQRAIYIVARAGGKARLVHRFRSEQDFSGLGLSPDARWAVYAAPANDGHFQLFRIALAGGTPTQLTSDPTDKTQPAVSRDGAAIAFTVFVYQMQFWTINP